MGYTHYFKFRKPISQIDNGNNLFKHAVDATKDCIALLPKRIPFTVYNWDSVALKSNKVVKRVSLRLGDGLGEHEPIFRNDLIQFNGWAAKGYDHEPFSINVNDTLSDSCKTAQKPYDVAVCIALLCFKFYFGDDFEFRSDGSIEAGDAGWKLAKRVTDEYFRVTDEYFMEKYHKFKITF